MPRDISHQQQPIPDPSSYGSVLREVGQTAKELVRNEARLMSLELRNVAQKVARHSAEAAAFGGLLVFSIFPFLAFLVIGLGHLLDDRFWLSSLIIAIACAAIGGFFAYRAYRKITDEDLDLSMTKSSLNREKHTLQNKINDLKHAVRGDRHDKQEYSYPH